MNLNIIISFLTIFLEVDAAGKSMNFYESHFTLNPKYGQNGTHSVKQIRSVLYLDFDFDVATLVRSVTAKVVFNRFDNGFKPYILNETINLCKATKDSGKAKYHYLLQRLFSALDEHTNALYCPYKVSCLEISRICFEKFYF